MRPGAGGRRFEVFSEDTQTAPQLRFSRGEEAHRGQQGAGRARHLVFRRVAGRGAADQRCQYLLMNTRAPPPFGAAGQCQGLSYRFQATNDRFGRAFAELCQKEGFKRPATMRSTMPRASATRKASRRPGSQGRKVFELWSMSRTSRAIARNCRRFWLPSRIHRHRLLSRRYHDHLREWFQTGETTNGLIPAGRPTRNWSRLSGNEVAEGIFAVDSISNEGSEAFKAYDAAHRRVMNASASTMSMPP